MVRHAASSWLVDVNPQISWENPRERRSRCTSTDFTDPSCRNSAIQVLGSVSMSDLEPGQTVPPRPASGSVVLERGVSAIDADDGATDPERTAEAIGSQRRRLSGGE